MSGQIKDKEVGPQGGKITFDIFFFSYANGPLIDDDGFVGSGTLPKVVIKDPTNAIVADSSVPLGPLPVRNSIGDYNYTRDILIGDTVSSLWKIEWTITINSQLQTFSESFSVVASGNAIFTPTLSSDTRKGFAFNNPDLAIANNGFGAIITPDELRYVYGFGNELVAPNCDTITDDVLQWYVDNAVASIERELNIKIFPKKYLFRESIDKQPRDVGSLIEDVDFEFEEPYDFHGKEFREYIWIKLRKRPIISVEKVDFRDVASGPILDLLQWIKVNHEKGSIQFFPQSGSLAALPLFIQSSFPLFNAIEARGNYPDAYFIDYTAGFKNVTAFEIRHRELFPIIGMLSAINMLNDYGDGRSPGLASSSISLAGISESFATTQSATNALFGARILAYSKQIEKFMKNNRYKYSGILIGSL